MKREENEKPTTAQEAAAAAEEAAIEEAVVEEAVEEASAATTEEAAEATPKAEGAGATEPLLSPAATAALMQLATALTAEDKAVLATALGRLSQLAEAGQAAARQAEEEACLTDLAGEPAFADIRGRLPGMQALIESMPWLRALPLRDRLAVACCLDRGRQWQPPTEEERLSAVLSDPALLRALGERQASLRRAEGQGIPPTHRPGRAPAVLKAPPASLSEAKAEARRALHVR